MSIQPVVQVDPLVLESRIARVTVDIDSVGTHTFHTCPPGECWYVTAMDQQQVVGGLYTSQVVRVAPRYGTEDQTYELHLNTEADYTTGLWLPVAFEPFYMRPGDSVGLDCAAHTTDGDTTIDLAFDLANWGS